MIRAIVFDFDGLIIDSEHAVAGSYAEIYAAEGLEFPVATWALMVGTREHDSVLWDDLTAKTGRLFSPAEMDAARRQRSIELAEQLEPLPGVLAHLDAAAEARMLLAVASSSSAWWVRGHLERLGLMGRFEVVCTKEDAVRSKPDPGIYTEALRRLGVPAAQAFAFEDTEPGIAAAKAAGMRAVGVPGSFTEHMDFSAADVVLKSLAEMSAQELWERLERRK